MVRCAVMLLFVAVLTPPALAQVPVELPVAHVPAVKGAQIRSPVVPVTPSAKVVDGDTADWTGDAASYGSATRYSAGELIYTDHLFDAYGADNGRDAERQGEYGALWSAVPETSRTEHVLQQANGELGLPIEQLNGEEHYGDLDHVDEADILRVRVAADAENLFVLIRTTTMTAAKRTAALILIESVPGNAAKPVPFGAKISSTAETALLITDAGGRGVRLADGSTFTFPAAVDHAGYRNAIEASVPLSVVGSQTPKLVVAAGAADGDAAMKAIANVAFRDEPIRTWMDMDQALALHAGAIDDFAVPFDVARSQGGSTESWAPGPGYHERIFTSTESVSVESGRDGLTQHYGVHIPDGYSGARAVPVTYWLHWRGGKTHSTATLAPKILRDFGDGQGGIVITPSGRGSSSWYLGKGHIDVLEVWDDVHDTFNVDVNRTYVSGHSMGGWGTYIMSILHPDLFAAALPVAGPVTQGAWTGVDFEGCDDLKYEDYTPCYVETNDSDPRSQHTRPLLENLRNVPIGIFQGAIDELVPVSGVTRQVQRLIELGFEHEYFLFPNYEHYSHPIVDEWMAGVRFFGRYTRKANPPRVTYVRDMVFERTVEVGPNQHEGRETGIDFSFDRAYWMSHLEPVSATAGTARFDGRSFGIAEAPFVMRPNVRGPAVLGQSGPFFATGLRRLDIGPKAPRRNAFDIALTGAKGVRLDLARMGISSASKVTGLVDADSPLQLQLKGGWTTVPTVRVKGVPVDVSLVDGVLTIPVPAGTDVSIAI